MQHFVISLCLILFLSSSNTVHAQSTELKSLAQWMEGSYSSQNQHLKDTANYFHIHKQKLHIRTGKNDMIEFMPNMRSLKHLQNSL